MFQLQTRNDSLPVGILLLEKRQRKAEPTLINDTRFCSKPSTNRGTKIFPFIVFIFGPPRDSIVQFGHLCSQERMKKKTVSWIARSWSRRHNFEWSNSYQHSGPVEAHKKVTVVPIARDHRSSKICPIIGSTSPGLVS